jgi:hypothetical protein
MNFQSSPNNRRRFLLQSLAGCGVLGSAWLSPQSVFADPTLVAARGDETLDSHVLTPAMNLASTALKSLEEVHDYSADFHKREMIGRKLIETKLLVKLREDPFAVYLKFLSPHAGREVIFVSGQNDNQLLVHETGFASLAGTLSLDPKGSYAMDENRYPVTNMGLRHMLTKLMETWLSGAEVPNSQVIERADVFVGTQKCNTVDVIHPRPHAKAKYHLTRLYVDQASGWPVRVQAYDFPNHRDSRNPGGTLVEDYTYSNLKVNLGLTNHDFSTRNKAYAF